MDAARADVEEKAMSLVLHGHPLSSFCGKVLIALYENGIDFEFRQLDLADDSARAAFRELWRIGKMPVLEDGGRAIVESSIIIEHLDLHRPGPVRMVPADPAQALPVRLLDRIFDQHVMRPIQEVVSERLRPQTIRDRDRILAGKAQLSAGLDWAERELDNRAWTAGESFSLADCAAAPAIHYAGRMDMLGGRPVLTRYLDRVKARASFRRVLEEAEPFAQFFPAED